MDNQEYEKAKAECWEEFWDEISGNIDFTPGVPDRIQEHIYATFDRAYALGKHEKDAEETVINGWVARNKYNEPFLYTSKPHRINCGIVFGEHTDAWSSDDLSFFPLDKDLFPNITWDNEPQEYEIIIKRKKNG